MENGNGISEKTKFSSDTSLESPFSDSHESIEFLVLAGGTPTPIPRQSPRKKSPPNAILGRVEVGVDFDPS